MAAPLLASPARACDAPSRTSSPQWVANWSPAGYLPVDPYSQKRPQTGDCTKKQDPCLNQCEQEACACYKYCDTLPPGQRPACYSNCFWALENCKCSCDPIYCY